MKRQLTILMLGLVIAIAAIGNSATIRVPADQPSIQAGIDAAADGDTVLVAAGTYDENLVISGTTTLLSEAGYAATYIQPQVSTSRLVQGSGSLTIKGFTFRNCNSDYGLYFSQCLLRFQDNLVSNMRTTWAPMLVWQDSYADSNCLVERCKFYNNAAGGSSNTAALCLMDMNKPSLISECDFHSNSGQYGGGVTLWNAKQATIVRCLFYDNTVSRNGSAVSGGGSGDVVNCTVYKNRATGDGVALHNLGLVKNSIIASNLGWGITAQIADYNDVWDNTILDYGWDMTPGAHDISADPQFLDTAAHDFRISSVSPCRNAGDPALQYNDPDGTRNDMGALWNDPQQPYVSNMGFGPSGNGDELNSQPPVIFWHLNDSLSAQSTQYHVEVGIDEDWTTPEMWDSGELVSSDSSALYAGISFEDHRYYFLRIRVSNGSSWGDWVSFRFHTRFKSIVHVPADLPTIQQGIDATEDGDTVLVGPGIYNENIDLREKRVTVLSSGGRDSTVIRAFDGYRPIITIQSGQDTTCVVDGFTVQNTINASGIWIYLASPVIRNCDVNSCVFPSDGGGIDVLYSSGIVENNRIHHNQGGNTGGGIRAHGGNPDPLRIRGNEIYLNNAANGPGIGCPDGSNLLIERNVLYQNMSAGSVGAAIYANGTDNRIINNTVVGNSNGIMLLNGARSDVRNNIIVLNFGAGLATDLATFDYNDVWSNGWSNTQSPHAISSDPQFVNQALCDYRLLSTSPCIDAGDPATQYSDPDGSRNDLGALCYILKYPLALNRGFTQGDTSHLIDHVPTFRWSYRSTSPGGQQAYRIRVGTNWTSSDVWDGDMVSSADSSAVYAGNPLVDGHRYFAGIRVYDGVTWGDWSPLTFRMNSKPEVPVLITPMTGAPVTSQQPTLTIVNTSDAEQDSQLCTFEVSPDSFTAVVYTFPRKPSGSSTTSIVVDSSLTENAKYWWRVKASDYYEESAYSEIRTFYVNTVNTPPAAFALSNPPDTVAEPLVTLLPQFTWAAAADPDPYDTVSYTLYLATDPHFNFVKPTAGLRSTSYDLADSLTWGTRYWWKVRANDRSGDSTWSTRVFSCRTTTLGDADGDGFVTLSDVVFLINYIFANGVPPDPMSAGDSNCDGLVNLSDAVYLINYIFREGAAPCAVF